MGLSITSIRLVTSQQVDWSLEMSLPVLVFQVMVQLQQQQWVIIRSLQVVQQD